MGSRFLRTNDLFIATDDLATYEALSILFTLSGYRVSVFTDAETFLAAARNNPPAGVLLDLHLLGLAVLKDLDAQRYPAPIFIISGDDDVACAVEAVKSGAFDYLLKPFDAHTIVTRMGNAITGIGMFEFSGQALLTPREREVLKQIAAGDSSREAGRHLNISPRTIAVHRARIMKKIGARNAADLMRIVIGGGNSGAPAKVPELVNDLS